MRKLLLLLFFPFSLSNVYSQGIGIPSKHGGIGFGNLPKFSGIRFNFIDKNIEKISGINISIWQPKEDTVQTGTITGLSVGLPMAMGSENRNGVGLGIFGVGAKKNLSGINLGGLGVGAGGDVTGINVGGLGIGGGGDIKGISIGGLGAGSGGSVTGINIGGLGVGAGESLKGFSFGGLGVGAGGKVTGISIGGLGVGAGGDLSGLSIGGIGVGSGGSVKGIAAALVGIGAGTEIKGLAIAAIGVGSPRMRAIIVSPTAGGNDIKGLFIVPAYLQVGNKNSTEEDNVVMKGISISAFNHIRGVQKGLTFGVFNYTRSQRGLQIGVLNYVKDNPKGLRLLPFFNAHFRNRSESGAAKAKLNSSPRL